MLFCFFGRDILFHTQLALQILMQIVQRVSRQVIVLLKVHMMFLIAQMQQQVLVLVEVLPV